jgi:putative restriction endonuclease
MARCPPVVRRPAAAAPGVGEVFYAALMDWVERVAGIRQYRRAGERAPHKPLLLLYALAHYQRHGDSPIRFSEAEAELAMLLREFGPPRETSPAYPFHHLVNDQGLWVVTTRDGPGSPGPILGALREREAAGRLGPELTKALADDSHLLAQLAHTLLDANFEPSLHPDICAAVGLDLERAELPKPPVAAGVRRRDPAFRRDVLTAYEYQCAFCGYDGTLSGSAVGLDAAHIRWFAFDGPDNVENGVCLCTLHHKLFDKGVLGLAEGVRIAVSAHFIARSPTARHHVLDLVGATVRPPQRGFPTPHPGHAAWHHDQVFRQPARPAAP